MNDLSNNFKIWQYGSLKVAYKPELDGAGSFLAPHFVKFFKKHSRYLFFPTVYEWCSGPGFIGFALLAEGICNQLVLSDINPDAIECIKETIRINRLENQVRYYISDNFQSIPFSEKFDLVVANPPRYVNVNPNHEYGKLYYQDLRIHDPNWLTHQGFYQHAHRYLNPGAHLFISEIEPYKQVIYIPLTDREPYDIREEPPIEVFRELMQKNQLEFITAEPYITIIEGVSAFVVVSRKKTSWWQRLTQQVNLYQ